MSISLVHRLRFDAARCDATFSKGVAGNIEEAAAMIERLRATLKRIANCDAVGRTTDGMHEHVITLANDTLGVVEQNVNNAGEK